MLKKKLLFKQKHWILANLFRTVHYVRITKYCLIIVTIISVSHQLKVSICSTLLQISWHGNTNMELWCKAEQLCHVKTSPCLSNPQWSSENQHSSDPFWLSKEQWRNHTWLWQEQLSPNYCKNSERHRETHSPKVASTRLLHYLRLHTDCTTRSEIHDR